MELEIYGGFYQGADAYYFIFGRDNPEENTQAEVIRVVKYSKSWKRLGHAAIKGDEKFGHQVGKPFHAGTVSVTESNGILYLATGHAGYVDPKYKQGHQGLLLIRVDETSMTGYIAHAQGKKIGKEQTFAGAISSCEPILENGKVEFYASDKVSLAFYSINTNTDAVSKKVFHSAGRGVGWKFDKNVLTFYGSGAIQDNFSEKIILTVAPMVKKIVIQNGITEIGKSAFYRINTYEEVQIQNGVKKIGEEAFGHNKNLDKALIPSSVTSIADNAFNTGWYWTYSHEPVRNVNIVCEKNSYAKKYADLLGIRNTVVGISVSAKSAMETGKPIGSPKARVIGTDGTVSFKSPFSNMITTLNIGNTFTFYGIPFDVVGIENAACKNLGKLKSVEIGKNVTNIGAGAFFGCKQLKTITIKTSKLNSTNIGADSFRGINANATIKVPTSVKSNYEKWLTKKGIGKKVKILAY